MPEHLVPLFDAAIPGSCWMQCLSWWATDVWSGSDSTDKNLSAFSESLLLPRRTHHEMTNCPSHRQDLVDDLTEEMTENFKLVI